MARKPKSTLRISNASAEVQAKETPLAPPTEETSLFASSVTKVIRSEFHKTLYCNYSKIGVTQWDFGVIIGQMVEVDPDTPAFMEELTIRFSPQYFKALATSLNAAIDQWEALFGPIQVGLGQQGNAAGMVQAFDALKGALARAGKK